MKEVQSVSALHSSDKVVDWEDKRNACPVALGTDWQSNPQFIAEPFTKVQANPGGTMNRSAILSGKSFLENAGQIALWDSDSIILYR